MVFRTTFLSVCWDDEGFCQNGGRSVFVLILCTWSVLMALRLLHDSVQQQGVELPVIAAFLWGAGLQDSRKRFVLVHCAVLPGRSGAAMQAG